MIKYLICICLMTGSLSASESITSTFKGYRNICAKAAVDDVTFNSFRSMDQYRIVLELEHGQAFADYVQDSEYLMGLAADCRRLDDIGNPPLQEYENLGTFTATTLRYMVLADQMNKIFKLPIEATIAEIGVGFGGQCYVLSRMNSFKNYYMYDLPEVESLVGRVMSTLQVSSAHCIPIEVKLPVDELDLVISNYAFSECDRDMQMYYFDTVIKKAKRGYIIYNQISEDTYNVPSMSLNEFVGLLRKEGFKPRVFHEFLSTAPENMLVTWDLTKTKK